MAEKKLTVEARLRREIAALRGDHNRMKEQLATSESQLNQIRSIVGGSARTGSFDTNPLVQVIRELKERRDTLQGQNNIHQLSVEREERIALDVKPIQNCPSCGLGGLRR